MDKSINFFYNTDNYFYYTVYVNVNKIIILTESRLT